VEERRRKMRLFKKRYVRRPKSYINDCSFCKKPIIGEHYYIAGIIFDEFQYGRVHLEHLSEEDTYLSLKRQQVRDNRKMVREWNTSYEIGTPVYLTEDNGDIIETRTRSEAWLCGGHTAIVSVEGKSGGYLLSRIQAKEV